MRTWFIEQLARGTAPNNLYFGVRLIGDLDLAALDLSVKTVVERHEALRTTFDKLDGEPVQWIHRDRPAGWTVIDLGANDGADLEQEAYAIARREIYKPFDLTAGPLFRVVLLRLRHQAQVMLVILHHIVCDGGSLDLLAYELATAYAAFCGGKKPTLEPPPLQYADYARWQTEWLGSTEFRGQLSYWTEKLAGAPLLLDLSVDAVRPTAQSFDGSTQTRRLPKHLVQQLQGIARRYNVTPFTLLLTVFQILLYHYSGERDFLIGVPVAARRSVELEKVVGLFANLVVVRADLSGSATFPELLREVRNQVLGALMFQDVPFERLVEAVHPTRGLAHNPIFQILFTSVKTPPLKSFGDLKASPYVVESSATAFDMSASLIEESLDVWWIRIDHRTDLFTFDQIRDLLDHFIDLLDSITARSAARLSQLSQPFHWPVANGHRDQGETSDDGAILNVAAQPDVLETNLLLPVGIQKQSGDLIEEALTSLWTKALGVCPPSVASNFFDVGGHSLMAVHLTSEISRAYGKNLPVSFVFQHPTIEGMARYLREETSEASSLVPIQQGGLLPPFFCGGSMRQFRDLSRALGPDLPVFQLDMFALQERRLFAGEQPYTSIPDLANSFRQDILLIQPRGPYFLGGMCDGGIVVLEIALQLQAEGHQVALLAQFDTPVNGYWRKRPIDWLMQAASLIRSRKLISKLSDRWRARQRRHVSVTAHEERFLYLSTVIWNAIYAYRPKQTFDGEIHIFRGTQKLFVEDVVAGWKSRTSHGIRVHNVDGEHGSILTHPSSQGVIASVFEEAHRRTGRDRIACG
jgi:thioesterase domain-containing protein